MAGKSGEKKSYNKGFLEWSGDVHTRTRGSRAHVASQVQSKSGVAHVDRLRHCRVQPNKHTYILTHLREAKELHSQHICTLRNERVSKRLKSSTEEGS